jgi:hypothetical protein
VGWLGEEGLWLPEEALPFTRGGGGVATPAFGLGLGFPTPRKEPREPDSGERTWRGVVVTEDSTFCPQEPGEDDGGIVRGVLCSPYSDSSLEP